MTMDAFRSVKKTVLSFLFLYLQDWTRKFQFYWWKISGIEKQIEDLNTQGSSSKSKLLVQSLKPMVKLHSIATVLLEASLDNFILWHEDFFPLERILQPNVAVYMLQDEYVYFIEVKNQAELYDTRKFPFYYNAQEIKAERIFRLHRTALIQYAHNFKTVNRKVTWIFHVGRCGSTALSQAYHALPNWTVLAEHGLVTYSYPTAAKKFEDVVDYYKSAIFRDTVVAAIHYELSRIPHSQSVCWKLYAGSQSPYLIPTIAKEFPEHKILFINRSAERVCDSFYMPYGLEPFMKTFIELVKDNPIKFVNGVLNEATLKFWADKDFHTYQLFYSEWITIHYVLRELSHTVPLMFIDYKEFMSDLPNHLEQVLQYSGVSTKHVTTALQTYSQDSQKGTLLSRERKLHCAAWKRDEKIVEKCNALARALGLPEFDCDLTKSDLNLKNATFLLPDKVKST